MATLSAGDYYYCNPIYNSYANGSYTITTGNTSNYQPTYNPPYTYQAIDYMPRTMRFRCKYCRGIVFNDERECPGCGAREFYNE